MAKKIQNKSTFSKMIAPIKVEEFFSEYHDKKHLHIPSTDTDKFADVMSWDGLNRLLNMTSVWTSSSLQLVLDKTKLAPEEYCQPIIGREQQEILQPNPNRVREWLRKGATLIANDVDALDGKIADVATILERELGAKVQCNIYFSMQGHQGFDVHFDVHEVFALHIIGEKVWKLYEGRLDNPINDAYFGNLGVDFCNANCGKVQKSVTMKPGDILYIPRGQFHDALSSSDASLHLTFGITHIIGHDVMSLIFQRAVADPVFRSNLPLIQLGPAVRANWLNELAKKVSTIANDESLKKEIARLEKGFSYHRGGFNLPKDLSSESPNARYLLSTESVRVKKVKDTYVLQGKENSVKIPEKYQQPVTWMINKGEFSVGEMLESCPQLQEADAASLIQDLRGMKVIRPI